jgi:formylglycine-generating enzyme
MHWRGSLVLVCGLVSGCLVSFDGYRNGSETGGAGQGADGANGGDVSGGKSTGGKGSGGKTSSGASSGGDAGEPVEGGESGSGGAVNGGSAGNPPAGSDPGGSAGSGGGGAGGGGSGSGGGGSGGAPPKSCPVNLEGPAMIEVLNVDNSIYCIDRTEVPNEDYAAFLATNPGTANQSAACSWNNSFLPDTSNTCATGTGVYDPVARPRMPVSCIDWCDAKRYCEWAGKRLCGNTGGGSNPPQDYDSAEDSQWYRACSRAGSRLFPYGNQYQSTYCNGVDSPYFHPAQVAIAVNCDGGYSGIFDMSGNVAEWEDSCSANAGAGDSCLIRGGSLQDAETTVPSLLCNDSVMGDQTPSSVSATRSTKDEFIGFRCCYDP